MAHRQYDASKQATGGLTRRELLRRAAVLGLAPGAMAGFLAACGDGGATTETGTEPAAAGTGAATGTGAAGGGGGASGELDFLTFYTGADGGIMQSIVDAYNEQSDGPTINFTAPAHGDDYLTALQTSVMSGNPPPIVALHNYEIPPLADNLHEIDPEALGINRDDYIDLAWELPSVDGRLLGLTMSTGTLGLFYNKDHFEEAGLDPESPPTNQDEFIEAAVALTRDGRYGFVRDPGTWMPWLTYHWQAGGQLLSEDGTQALWNTPEAIRAAQLEQDIIQEHQAAVPDVIADDLEQLLYSGQVSMIFLGPWNLNQVIATNEEQGTNFGWAMMPQFFEEERAVMSTSHIYSLMRRDDEDPATVQAAGEFIAWLLEEGSVDWAAAQAPTNKAVVAEMETSDDPAVQGMTMWVEQGEYAHFPPYHPQWGEAYRLLVDAMQSIAHQGADVESTLNQVTEQANEVLSRGA